jgi:integrase
MPRKHYGKWSARWYDENGVRHRKNFDDHRVAKAFEERMKADVAEVRRGLRDPAPPRKTFDELADRWLDVYAARKRSKRDDESILRQLRPFFAGVPLRDITVELVERYVSERPALSDKTIANHLTLLVAMLNRARALGWIVRVPEIKKPRVRVHRHDFRYLRTQDEIDRFLLAAPEQGEVVFAMYAAALWSGAREGELAGLEWGDVDFDKRLITIQRSFDGPTKSDDVRHVPILDPLLVVLRRWRLACPGRIVFPNEAGRMHTPSARMFQEVLHRVLATAGFTETVSAAGKIRRYITFHGLRHTFASHYVMHGGDLFRLQRILGHKTVQMTMRYAHLAPHAFRDDYARLSSKVVDEAPVVSLAEHRIARVS